MGELWLCLKCGKPYGSPNAKTCRQGCGSGSCQAVPAPEQLPLFGATPAPTPERPHPVVYPKRCPQYAVCVAEGLDEGECETCPARPSTEVTGA